MIPEGYWQNAAGDLVKEDNVKDQHKMEDELVRTLFEDAADINRRLAAFRIEALESADALKALVAEQYGATMGGADGNMTLRSYDGSLEMQIAVAKHLSFGPELQAAKELIDGCVRVWSADANANVQTLIEHAFQTNKEGKIDTSRVLGLRQIDIDDPDWTRAMDALSDALRVVGSKTYVRFYQIDKDGARTSVPLSISQA